MLSRTSPRLGTEPQPPQIRPTPKAYLPPNHFPLPSPSRLICFNKPYGVLSQFTPEGRWRGLREFITLPDFYAAGRLDADSEGLLLLTNDGQLQARIADPRFKMEKSYWAQVEGVPGEAALQALRQGVMLKDGLTRPARARLMAPPPDLWEREPPIRVRQARPTAWLELVIREGRNRQVRRMTAAVGFPTLRLIRAAIGLCRLDTLAPGIWREGDPLAMDAPPVNPATPPTQAQGGASGTSGASPKAR